jgi:hypothetical protein
MCLCMATTTTTCDFAAVPEQAAKLGFSLPQEITILPINFEIANLGDELRFRGEAVTIAKLLNGAGIEVSRLGANEGSEAFVHNKSHEWALPIIFIGSELMKTSPDLISLAFSTVQDYVLELFKGMSSGRTIKAEVVIERSKTRQYQKISYEGDPSGLKDFAKVVKAASKK